jgi:hypothetical protein
VFALVSLAVLAVVIRELGNGSERMAFVICFFPLAAWLVARPMIPLVMLGASLPFVTNLAGSGASVSVAASDLLLALVAAGILFEASVAASPQPAIRSLHPVRWPVLAYTFFIVALIPFHASVNEVLQTVQRFELYLIPLVVGAFAVLIGWHEQLLKAYVLGCTALAAIFPFNDLGLQHNPVGQFIANAILLVVALRALRAYWPCLVILVPSLIHVESRGSVVALVVGAVVLVAFQREHTGRVWRRLIPLIVLGIIVFLTAPASIRDRLTTFSSGTQTRAQYALTIRQRYAHDAHRIIHAHPWTGVGVGNYAKADVALIPHPIDTSADPHQVILLQEAEGGYGLAVAFLILVVGSFVVLWRMRRIELAPVTAAVLAGGFAHGLVDVYWVRGTPVLGWLLVGMVCAQYLRLNESRVSS